MTRQPDIKSKTKRIVYIPISIEEEKKSDDFKTLCKQDGLKARDLLNEAFDLVFKVHHWPPGNPQLTLKVFADGKPKIELGKCGYANCSYKAIEVASYLPNKREYKLCEKHLKQAKSDAKNWVFQEKQRGVFDV